MRELQQNDQRSNLTMKAQHDKGGFFGTMQMRLRLRAHDLIQPYLHSRSNINVSPLNRGLTPPFPRYRLRTL